MTLPASSSPPPLSAPDSGDGTRLFTDRDAVIHTGVLDPAVLARHLRGNPLSDTNGETVTEIQVLRVLKHHVDKRCTLEIAVRTKHGWQPLVAKIYRKDRSDVFEAMKSIQQAGFGPQDGFSIPQPVGFSPSLRCLLQEKVGGTPADGIFVTGDDAAGAATAERCARWLARFHARAPKVGPVSHPKDFMHSKAVERWSRKVATLEGDFGQKAAHLLRRLEHASRSLCDVELKAGHGSYNAAHVYLSSDRTVTIDWDWHDVADPARDVARFLYALRRWALDQLGSIRALDRAADVFLKTYLLEGSPEVERNLPFFEAATCLNLAVRHLFDEGPGWVERQTKAEAMLNEGISIVEGTVTP
jgi:hypothetical protein